MEGITYMYLANLSLLKYKLHIIAIARPDEISHRMRYG